MSDSSLPRRILIAIVIGAVAVVANDPGMALLILAGGAAYAIRAMVIGRGWGRDLRRPSCS